MFNGRLIDNVRILTIFIKMKLSGEIVFYRGETGLKAIRLLYEQGCFK